MLLKKSRIMPFILKEILFSFQRYKYFKLLVFWQLCDVTVALHQFHTCKGRFPLKKIFDRTEYFRFGSYQKKNP